MTTVYSAHQPDLLPYSGFWYKMAKADVFDLKIHDQFVDKGYQRRVKMRDEWVTLPLVKSSGTAAIDSKHLKTEAMQHLASQIHRRYMTAGHKKPRFWYDRKDQVMDEVLSIKTEWLWEANVQLIHLIRGMLGIDTRLHASEPTPSHLRGSAGIVNTIAELGTSPVTYLSGTGARTYMGDCAEFKEAGIPVIWSDHRAVTGDSILSVIFDYEDPLSTVLLEHEPTEQSMQLRGVTA